MDGLLLFSEEELANLRKKCSRVSLEGFAGIEVKYFDLLFASDTLSPQGRTIYAGSATMK